MAQKTPEEERRIVRENALTQANELYRTLSKDHDTSNTTQEIAVATIIEMAKQFETWVFEDAKEPIPIVQSTKECPKCKKQIPRAYAMHYECGWKAGTP